MKKLLIRLLIGGISLLIVVCVLAYSMVRQSLPVLDGEVSAARVSAAVTIERDAAGIPTITAANRLDLAYGTGYAHGQDRFFQMDLTRRNSAGELAEIFGEVAVELDRRHRFHRFRTRAEAVVERLQDEERALLDAYANGVNDGLDQLGAKPFEYFVIGTEPEPWLPEDSLLAVYTMFLELNDSRANRDVRRGLAHRVLPAAVFDWLYPEGSEWDAPLMGIPRGGGQIPGPDVYSLRGRTVASLSSPNISNREPLVPGSNNWAIAGGLTASGRAIVANDMHLGITTPNVFYRARMRTSAADGIDLNGVTLPGTPLLVAGSNGYIAYGNTNSYGDWTDAVIVRPGPVAGTYLTADGPLVFDTFDEVIEVKGAAAAKLRIRETVWGPVREDNPDPDNEIVVSWLAHHLEAVTLGHLRLEMARSVNEALVIANNIGMPPQNFVVGDSAGNIGWTIAGKIPRRVGFDPLLPADWSEGNGWHGWVAPADYPRLLNPDSGRIWTANSRVADGHALDIIGDGGYDLGARARQIRDGLFASDELSPDDMLGVQLDDRALFLARWRDLLLQVLNDAATGDFPARREYRRLAEGWVPHAAPESVGYRLVRAFRTEVRDRVFEMMLQPVWEAFGEETELRMSNQFESPLWSLVTERPPHLLTDDYANWDELFLAAVDTNIRYFEENYAGGLDRRSWGERNTAAIRHPLSAALPFLSNWLDMPREPLHGDSNLPRAQSPSFGASERFAVSPGDESSGYLHMPAGQSGHPLSDYYHIGHDDWVQGKPSAFLPGPPRHTLVLRAAE